MLLCSTRGQQYNTVVILCKGLEEVYAEQQCLAGSPYYVIV